MDAAANTLISTFSAEDAEEAEDLDEEDAEEAVTLLPQAARDSAMHSARSSADNFFMRRGLLFQFI
jgi:F0F1-type ATP synthase epsilon subunit